MNYVVDHKECSYIETLLSSLQEDYHDFSPINDKHNKDIREASRWLGKVAKSMGVVVEMIHNDDFEKEVDQEDGYIEISESFKMCLDGYLYDTLEGRKFVDFRYDNEKNLIVDVEGYHFNDFVLTAFVDGYGCEYSKGTIPQEDIDAVFNHLCKGVN
jgi:hypothetical protein